MGLGEAFVNGERLAHRLVAKRGLSCPVARERQLVQNVRRSIVKLDVGLIVIGGRRKPVAGVVDVTEQLAGPRSARVDIGGPPEVSHGRLELVAAPVGFAAHQVPDHRIALERDRAAEGLDCRREISGGHRRVSPPDLVAVVALPPDDEVTVDYGPSADQEER